MGDMDEGDVLGHGGMGELMLIIISSQIKRRSEKSASALHTRQWWKCKYNDPRTLTFKNFLTGQKPPLGVECTPKNLLQILSWLPCYHGCLYPI